MKKFISIITLICALCSGAHADINFVHDPWQQIVAQAAKENKLVFLDAYTSWCGPCKWMAKTAFVDPEVSDFFNSHFVNAKIDMEQGEGIELAKQFEVKAYPTLLFVDGFGKLVHATVGAKSAEDLLQLAREVLDGNVVSIVSMQARFEAGERDRKFLKDYILQLNELGRSFEEPIAAFEGSMVGEGLLDPNSWEVFQALYRRTNSPKARFFLTHLPEFEAKFGEQPVAEKAMAFFTDRIVDAASKHDRDSFKITCAEIKQVGWAHTDSIVAYMNVVWCQVSEDWKSLPKTTQRYLDLLKKPEPGFLNDVAWACHEHCDRKADLEQALVWVNQSIAAELASANLDTKAMLLMKLKRYSEAIPVAQESIRLGKAAGEDVSETEKALAEMQK